MELKNMVAMVARSGRQLQRYNKDQRQVVGCIPYRYKGSKMASGNDLEDALEVLVISSQRKGKGMLFPKGGWESDESIKEAALRETFEEAGVVGTVEDVLGKWNFKSKTHDSCYEGYMFPLLVQGQLDFWPEKHIRQRVWVSVPKAKEVCQHLWMKEALDLLVDRLASPHISLRPKKRKRDVLGKWNFKSKIHDSCYEGYTFPLLVQRQVDFWLEKHIRQRVWVSVPKAKEVCQHSWMKEALDLLVDRLASSQEMEASV